MALTPDQKGAIAEAAIAYQAARHAITVLRPLCEGVRYDLAFDIGDRLVRVQCKWAPVRGDVVVVGCRTSRRVNGGYKRTSYTAAEVELIAAYAGDVDRSFLVLPHEFEGHEVLSLRLATARNNQQRGVRWADDYDFGARLRRYNSGAIAQLGERLHGMQEVAGSSPAGSTVEAAASGLSLFQ
jgi:hypothetical protein